MVQAVLVNLSNVVVPAMEAYGLANLAAVKKLVEVTGVPEYQLIQEMKTAPMPDAAYLPGNAPKIDERRPALFENNTFYGPDWMMHLPSVEDFIHSTGTPTDYAETAKAVLAGAIRVHQDTLRDSLKIFPDFAVFHSRMLQANPGCKFILIPDVKADYTTTMINTAEVDDGTYRVGHDFFDHVFAPPANKLHHKFSRQGTGTKITVLPPGIRKPAAAFVDFIAKHTGIAPEDWLVIGEKADKDGMIVAGTSDPDLHFVQIKREGIAGRGTEFMKKLSNYGARAAVDVKAAEQPVVTPTLVISTFEDEQLATGLNLAASQKPAAPQPGGMG